MNPIGIMQGRLSPPGARPQTFPRASWRDEFDRARDCGFDRIEWLLAADGLDDNPLLTDHGIREIRRQAERTGIRVSSVCADCFMVRPLAREDWRANAELLGRIVQQSADAGIDVVVVPILETAAIRDAADRVRLLEALRDPLAQAERAGVRIALESDLAGDDLREIIDASESTFLGVCYDVGNATAAGHDLEGDLRALAPRLFGVHIKDRVRNGTSRPLGEGEVDFDAVAKELARAEYMGSMILETPVGADAMASARRNLSFLRGCLSMPIATT
jgi:L-ribulose-5-phosphate 3-epimerase